MRAAGLARTYWGVCHPTGLVEYVLATPVDFKCQRKNVALMCAEKDPIECHRTLLVARSLVASGCVVKHILADGEFENHEAAVERIYEHLGRPKNQMCIFENTAESRDDAIYKEQERRIKNRLKRHRSHL